MVSIAEDSVYASFKSFVSKLIADAAKEAWGNDVCLVSGGQLLAPELRSRAAPGLPGKSRAARPPGYS